MKIMCMLACWALMTGYGALAADQNRVTLIVCNDSIISTMVVIDDHSILYLASNASYTQTGVVPAESATILKQAELGRTYIVLAIYPENILLRYMETTFGQSFAVMLKGVAAPFAQVPFGVVKGSKDKGEGYFAKVVIARKALDELPTTKEELLSFSAESIEKLSKP